MYDSLSPDNTSGMYPINSESRELTLKIPYINISICASHHHSTTNYIIVQYQYSKLI